MKKESRSRKLPKRRKAPNKPFRHASKLYGMKRLTQADAFSTISACVSQHMRINFSFTKSLFIMLLTKQQIRTHIARKKKQQNGFQLSQWSVNLLKKLEEHPRFRQAKTLLLYYSLPDEVQTHDFVERWSKSKQIILPVVKGDELELRQYTGKQDLQKSSYNIYEPTGKELTQVNEIDLALIPGVSFDLQGNRLGRGKGYYDRLLPRLRSYNIGICFGFQISEAIPTETFDRPMDEIWTENGCVYVNEK